MTFQAILLDGVPQERRGVAVDRGKEAPPTPTLCLAAEQRRKDPRLQAQKGRRKLGAGRPGSQVKKVNKKEGVNASNNTGRSRTMTSAN